MYICVTEIDAATKIPCTVEPQKTGPSLPDIKNLVYVWDDRSTWPVSTDSTGVYLHAPRYYCICDDDADTSINGVLEILTEQQWAEQKEAELASRPTKPE